MFFEYPKLLWLMVIPALLVLHYLYLELAERHPHFRVSTAVPWLVKGTGFKSSLRHVPFILRIAALCLIVVAIARPRSSEDMEKIDTEGIDIVLAMDVSTSMLAEDLKPNRIEAAKDVAHEFISGRPNDNIGLTIFAGEAFTQCPMTTDRKSLLNMLNNIRTDIAARGYISDGTAVGMGLANAISRLKDSKTKSKVVILLTDGSNNRGEISPLTAAQMAKSFGIRVYTIAVGTNGIAPYPTIVSGTVQYMNVKADVDTETLMKIASSTDGNFYRATNTDELKKIYDDIDKLEKSKLSVKNYSRRYDAYQPFALIALIALIMELLIRHTILRRLP